MTMRILNLLFKGGRALAFTFVMVDMGSIHIPNMR